MNYISQLLDEYVQQNLSGLYESKYFDALTELVAQEVEVTKTWLLNKSLNTDELRFYQGRAEGLEAVLNQIKFIHQEFIKPK